MSMKEPSPRRRVKFNGTFTEEVRRLIKRKREELGLPYLAIAEYFKINWSTFRKWESGETVKIDTQTGKFLGRVGTTF